MDAAAVDTTMRSWIIDIQYIRPRHAAKAADHQHYCMHMTVDPARRILHVIPRQISTSPPYETVAIPDRKTNL